MNYNYDSNGNGSFLKLNINNDYFKQTKIHR